jgi:catechol 2,3-dioxygenase-like lactoylglutathione lyase family enzyme
MKWNQMIPEFDVLNLGETLHFYVDLIGFKVVYDRPEDKFAFIEMEDVQFMVQEIDPTSNKWDTGTLDYPLGRGINFQIDVKNIDEIYNKLKEADYKIFVEMEDHYYRKDDEMLGEREFLVQDPNGFLLRFAQDI